MVAPVFEMAKHFGRPLTSTETVHQWTATGRTTGSRTFSYDRAGTPAVWRWSAGIAAPPASEKYPCDDARALESAEPTVIDP